ncbi:uncharacterized protein LOC141913306 [Tubulanus polymorphus]|uniref:uncharacterized protein LOC141913306 n=1 Tax=Tubulanus polymorphus TaxID=672921 RepID=UPI003DA31277
MDAGIERGLFLILLCLILCVSIARGARGGRGGGSRSGYSSYGSSYSSYRGSSYRSSSTYQSSRYSLAYSESPSKYYSLYFYYSSRPRHVYFNRPTAGSRFSVCKNFEKNENGSYLGSFQCPLHFEPSEFTYCCGSSNAEYCCPDQTPVTAIAVGVSIACLIIVGIILFYLIPKCSRKLRKTSPVSETSLPQASGPVPAQNNSVSHSISDRPAPPGFRAEYPPPDYIDHPNSVYPPPEYVYPPNYVGPPRF